ncbi:MAG: sugar phosphate isomerase/epimerase family protein [Terriglobia bacterium]
MTKRIEQVGESEPEGTMKFGANTLIWTMRVTREHESLFSHIRDWGFNGVELFVSPQEPSDVPTVRRMLDALGLDRTACTVLPCEAHLVSSDAETRARGVKYVERCIERAAELGAQLLCGPLYAGLGVITGCRRTDEEWKRAVEGVGQAARRAQELGVVLCLEPLNRFETYFLNTLEDAARLTREVGMTNVRVHFDTFHANIEEKHPASALRSVARELGHVHISENDRGIPGSGHVDWKAVVRTLKEIGYDQWLTIESFARPDPALAAAAIWRDFAPSGDELARQGLAFIKGVCKEAGAE